MKSSEHSASSMSSVSTTTRRLSGAAGQVPTGSTPGAKAGLQQSILDAIRTDVSFFRLSGNFRFSTEWYRPYLESFQPLSDANSVSPNYRKAHRSHSLTTSLGSFRPCSWFIVSQFTSIHSI